MADYILSDTYQSVQKVLTYRGPKLRIREGNCPAYVPHPFRPYLIFNFNKATYNPNNDSGWVAGGNWTKVDNGSYTNLWKYSRDTTSFASEFRLKRFGDDTFQFSVISGDIDGVTDISEMFYGDALRSFSVSNSGSLTNCASAFSESEIVSCPVLDTSHVTNFSDMLSHTPITSVYLYDTSSATDVSNMFDACLSVTTGALALYNQMSTQANVPASHADCFSGCGANTTTGQNELKQIPQDWGGEAVTFDSVKVYYAFNPMPASTSGYVGAFKLGSSTGSNVTALDGSYTAAQLNTLSNGGTCELNGWSGTGTAWVELDIQTNATMLYQVFNSWYSASNSVVSITVKKVVGGVETVIKTASYSMQNSGSGQQRVIELF